MRKRIFRIIEASDGDDIFSSIYDYIMIVAIAMSLLSLAFKEDSIWLTMTDRITAYIFIVDYLLRLVTADLKFGKKSVTSFIRYPFSPMAIIDLLSILPSFTFVHAGFKVLRIFRMARVLRVFKAVRYSESIVILGRVFKMAKDALVIICTLAFIYIIIMALVIFNVEPESFNNFFDAVYWTTISLITGGHEGSYPATTVGRIITMLSSVFNVIVVALTGGIITAEYINIIKFIKHKNKDENKRNKD